MHDEQEVSWIICPRMRKRFAESGYVQVTQPLGKRTSYWHSPFLAAVKGYVTHVGVPFPGGADPAGASSALLVKSRYRTHFG